VSYSTSAAFEAVCAIVAALPGPVELHRGAPESLATRTAAYVSVGGSVVRPKLIGRVDERESRIRVVFSVRVGADETAAEATLAGLVDALAVGLGTDPSLGGTVSRIIFDAALADPPEYAVLAGPEYRIFPCSVTVFQRQAYAVA
jgi:hypothetical protein